MNTNLYILGNGFDLMHEIPSSYSDFARFCKKKNKSLFDIVNKSFPSLSKNPDNLWSNFEEALGTPDYNFMLKEAKKNDIGKIENMEKPLGVDYCELRDMMTKWIESLSKSIEVTKVSKQMYFDKENAFFLTFNYTNTLEEVYGIPSDICCHIHEGYDKTLSVDFVGYNWGHSKCENEINTKLKSLRLDATDVIPHDIKEAVMYFGKRYDDGNRKLESWMESIPKQVNDIIVMGHSMAEVDYPYFKSICETYPSAKWHIFYFNQNDLNRKRKVVVDLEIADRVELLGTTK